MSAASKAEGLLAAALRKHDREYEVAWRHDDKRWTWERKAAAILDSDFGRYLAALERVAETGAALDAFATWSALNRPETTPFREALRTLAALEDRP